MTDGLRFIHLSVFDGNVNYFSKFGRVIVTADIENDTLDCCCCCSKRLCVLKCICFLYFLQNNLLDVFRQQSTEIKEDEPAKEDCPTPHIQSANQIYPPNDQSIVAKMCSYLHSFKCIPLYETSKKNSDSNPLKKIYPKGNTLPKLQVAPRLPCFNFK